MRSHLPPRSTSVATNASDGLTAAPDEMSRAYEGHRALAARMARSLLRIDGVFEGVLGALLILSPVTGLYSALALPAPASQPIVVVVGLLLLPLLPVLWRLSRAPQWRLLLVVAGTNSLGALVLLVWVVYWHTAFHPAGTAFVLVVAAILFVLDLLQSATAINLR